MRVAHVVRKLDASKWGGVETHVAALTSALDRIGVDGEIHAPRGPAEPTTLGRAPVRRYSALLPVLGDRTARERLWEVGGNLVSPELFWRLARGEAGIAHLHTQGRVGGSARSAMRLRGRPYVVSVHGPLASAKDYVSEEDAARRRETFDFGQPFGALVGARRVLADAAASIVFNRDEEDALRVQHPGMRIVRMRQGVDLSRFDGLDGARGRARFAALGDAPFVLVLGRVGRQKDPLLAIDAFAKSGFHGSLVFAGASMDAELDHAMIARAHAYGVAERVIRLGNVEPTHVPELLAAAELVLVPSLHEAFGLQVIEAWAARRPVLFASVGGLADLASELREPRAVVASRDADLWGERLRALLGSPDTSGALAARGRAHVEHGHTWAEVARRHAELYAEVVESARCVA